MLTNNDHLQDDYFHQNGSRSNTENTDTQNNNEQK